ncbi:MAG: hypothetical protein MHPSP_002246 [Paramarteilia canceri]
MVAVAAAGFAGAKLLENKRKHKKDKKEKNKSKYIDKNWSNNSKNPTKQYGGQTQNSSYSSGTQPPHYNNYPQQQFVPANQNYQYQQPYYPQSKNEKKKKPKLKELIIRRTQGDKLNCKLFGKVSNCTHYQKVNAQVMSQIISDMTNGWANIDIAFLTKFIEKQSAGNGYFSCNDAKEYIKSLNEKILEFMANDTDKNNLIDINELYTMLNRGKNQSHPEYMPFPQIQYLMSLVISKRNPGFGYTNQQQQLALNQTEFVSLVWWIETVQGLILTFNQHSAYNNMYGQNVAIQKDLWIFGPNIAL